MRQESFPSRDIILLGLQFIDEDYISIASNIEIQSDVSTPCFAVDNALFIEVLFV